MCLAADAVSRLGVGPLATTALLLAAVITRLPYLDVPISADEGGYATAAYWWARGDDLYREITITRPQGIFVIYRLIDALGLGSTVGIHVFAAAWVALAALLLSWAVACLWGRSVGLASAVLFAAVMATPWLEGYSANAELFMALPLLLGLWALLQADSFRLSDRRALGWLFGSGFAAAVAVLVKPSGLALLAFGALWLARRWRSEQRPPREWLTAEICLLLGWALGILPALLHGVLTVPDRYFDAVLFYRLGQDSIVGGSISHQLTYFATNAFYIVWHVPIFLLVPLGLRLSAHDGNPRARDFLVLWMATAFGGAALGGNWFLHYHQQLLPPVAAATVLAVRHLLRRPLGLPRFAAVCLAVVALLVSLAPIPRAFTASVVVDDLPEWEPGVTAAAPVAAYLATHTGPADTIYVVYDHADIYYLAQRRPAARWLHFRELAGVPGAFDEQVARIADWATAPLYIVEAQAFDRWGFDPHGKLRAVIASNYRLETTIEGLPIYRRLAGLDAGTSGI